MTYLVDNIKDILGEPNFYLSNGNLDYGQITLYLIGGILLCIVVSSLFKLLRGCFK